MRNLMFAFITALTLTACATVPKSLQGDYSTLSPRQALAGNSSGQRVRWGGEIIKVEPRSEVTCFEILSHDLSATSRPLRKDHSEGRFIACRDGFYDPALFVAGRQITVVGTLSGTEKHAVGGYDYTYPKINADAVHLWPKYEPEFRNYYDPWWPYPYAYDPLWWGWWGPPIIVEHRPIHHHLPPPHPHR